MKKAAIEAEAWGIETIKSIHPARLKHIHDRVCSIMDNNHFTALILIVRFVASVLGSRDMKRLWMKY